MQAGVLDNVPLKFYTHEKCSTTAFGDTMKWSSPTFAQRVKELTTPKLRRKNRDGQQQLGVSEGDLDLPTPTGSTRKKPLNSL